MQRNTLKLKSTMRWQFQSLQDLIQHFGNRLSVLEIENIIRETGQLFICRGAKNDEQERMAFIERCQQALQGSLLLHEQQFIGEMSKLRA